MSKSAIDRHWPACGAEEHGNCYGALEWLFQFLVEDSSKVTVPHLQAAAYLLSHRGQGVIVHDSKWLKAASEIADNKGDVSPELICAAYGYFLSKSLRVSRFSMKVPIAAPTLTAEKIRLIGSAISMWLGIDGNSFRDGAAMSGRLFFLCGQLPEMISRYYLGQSFPSPT